MYVSIYESVPLGIAVVLLRLPPFIVTWFPTAMLPLLYHARSGQYLIRRVVVQNAAVASIPILLMRSLFAKLSSRDYLRICYKAACPGCKSVNYLFQLLVHSSISVYYKHECGAVITHPVSAHWGKRGGGGRDKLPDHFSPWSSCVPRITVTYACIIGCITVTYACIIGCACLCYTWPPQPLPHNTLCGVYSCQAVWANHGPHHLIISCCVGKPWSPSLDNFIPFTELVLSAAGVWDWTAKTEQENVIYTSLICSTIFCRICSIAFGLVLKCLTRNGE